MSTKPIETCRNEGWDIPGQYRELTREDRKMVRKLIRDQSKIWDSSQRQTALELIRLLLFWIEENELSRKEVDRSVINEMYVDWYCLKVELIRNQKLLMQERR